MFVLPYNREHGLAVAVCAMAGMALRLYLVPGPQ